MEKKADVKAIMARFNTGGNLMEGTPGGRPTVHSTFSTGPPGPARKAALESTLSGGTTAPKPNFLKSTVSTQSAPETPEFPRAKALINKFPGGPEAGKSGGTPETGKPTFLKPQPLNPKPTEALTDGEAKAPVHKRPLQKSMLCATLSDPKTTSPKPPSTQAKPSWVKDSSKAEDSGSGSSSHPVPTKMTPAPKPKSTLTAMRSHTDELSAGETTKNNAGLSVKSSAFLAAQSAFNKESTEDASNNGSKPVGSQDTSGPKTPIAKKPSVVKKPVAFPPQKGKENEDPFAPKKNPLPNMLALGSAPAKPNRPPKVNLEKFKAAAEQNNPEGPGDVKKTGRPSPPAFHPSSNAAPPVPSQFVAPSLPPRPTGGIIQPDPDENYDDVGVMNNPPPLPAGGHPSQKQEESGSDEEMYEDLDDRWSNTDAKEQEKKKEKEEKKRQEQEKKEQKDKERKEQEIRKKFKISGPIQVIHKVKARVDCKGTKLDLSVKQGEPIEIVRITDNPEGRWLGRTRDGSYGYIKTESVEIDFDTLKRTSGTLTNQANAEPEVYDDVGAIEDSGSGVRGPGVFLPPPPGEDGEIYDELDDSDLNVSEQESKPSSKPRTFLRMLKGWDDWRRNTPASNQVPPPLQFTPDANTDQASLKDDEVYDDVDSQPGYPGSNPVSSLALKLKGKPEERDPKKQKKFEKEEKEFRKKFKFDGDIRVLYQVNVLSSLSSKKWTGKDLPLKPGEKLDVIVKPVDDKMICRNEDGKFGYVSTSSIVAEDLDIYDDIGDDCIYDND